MLNSLELQKQDLIQDEFGLGLAFGYCRRLKFTENNTPVIVAYLKALGNEINLYFYKVSNFSGWLFTV